MYKPGVIPKNGFDYRVMGAIFAACILSFWIGVQVVAGAYKSIFSLFVLVLFSFMLVRLSCRSLVYIILFLCTLPTTALFKVGGLSIRLIDILVPVVALRFLGKFIVSRAKTSKLYMPFHKYLVALLFIGILSLVKAYYLFDIDTLLASLVSLSRFWVFFLICLCIPAVIENRYDLQNMVTFLAFVGVFHAFFGVLDLVAYQLGYRHLITRIYDFVGRGYGSRFIAAYRVGGLQFTPENLGIMLGYFLPFILISMAHSESNSKWWVSGIALLELAIIGALARTGLLLSVAFCLGFCLFGQCKKSRKVIIVAGILLFMFGTHFSEAFQERLADITHMLPQEQNVYKHTSVQAYRESVDVWRDSLKTYQLQNNYWLGSGWGTLHKHFERYGYDGSTLQSYVWARNGVQTADNAYLQILNDIGLLGLLAFLAFWVSAAYLAWKQWRCSTDVFSRNLYLSVVLFMVLRGLQNMYATMLIRGDTYTMIGIGWIYIGLLSAMFCLDKVSCREVKGYV